VTGKDKENIENSMKKHTHLDQERRNRYVFRSRHMLRDVQTRAKSLFIAQKRIDDQHGHCSLMQSLTG